MKYAEQLKHPKWQKRRLEIMKRADFQCEACGAEDVQLHIHHKYYIKGRDVWNYISGAYSCLCEACHKQVEIYEHSLLYVIKPQDALEIVNLAESISQMYDSGGDLETCTVAIRRAIREINDSISKFAEANP